MDQDGAGPTLREVAAAAGVSQMTASYVYSQPDRVAPATAAKVRAAAEKLDYPGPHPGARSLRRGRAGSLGVVLGERLTYAFDDPQAARFLAGVAEVCAAEDVGLTLVPTTGAASDVQRVAEAVVDGFIVWTTSDDDPVLDAVAAAGCPQSCTPGRTPARAARGRHRRPGRRRGDRPAGLRRRHPPGGAQLPGQPRPRPGAGHRAAGPAVTYPVTRHRWEACSTPGARPAAPRPACGSPCARPTPPGSVKPSPTNCSAPATRPTRSPR